jgi:hypothetical protein
MEQKSSRQQLQQDLVWVFALGLLFRIILLILFPVPYGNDAAGRLYFRASILTWHWLPVTQAMVYLTYGLTQSIFAVRLLFAIAGSLAAVAFAFYLQTFLTRRAALIGGGLLAINSHAVYLSLMPYQEILFLGLFFGSLAFFILAETAPHRTKNFLISATLYGLACLTRYETWFILPALLGVRIWRAFASHDAGAAIKESSKSFIGLCWSPTLWLFINWLHWGSPTAFLFHRPDHAFYAWAPHGEFARIVNYIGIMFYWLFRFGSPLVLFAVPGIRLFWQNRRTLLPIMWPALLFLLLVLLFLIFVAGKEFASANRFAMIPLGMLLIFTAIGIDVLIARLSKTSYSWLQKLLRPAPKIAITVLLIFLLLIYGAVPVIKANHFADYREPYEIAKFLKAHLAANESAVVVATSFAGEAPMPYQRVFGQLDFDKEHLLCSLLIEPHLVANVETFVRHHNLRYVIIFGEDQPRQGNDAVFLKMVFDLRYNFKKIFSNNAATIYERKS